MAGTLANSHVQLNPMLRSSQPLVATVAATSHRFSEHLAGRFFHDDSLTGTTHRKEMAILHAEKLKERQLKMEETIAAQAAKVEEQQRLLQLRAKRDAKRQVCWFVRMRFFFCQTSSVCSLNFIYCVCKDLHRILPVSHSAYVCSLQQMSDAVVIHVHQ